MTCDVTDVVDRIEKAFPDISDIVIRRDDEIFLGDVAEGGFIGDLPACDYDAGSWDFKEEFYVMGVHKELAKLVEDCGWFVECGDPGTYFAYPA